MKVEITLKRVLAVLAVIAWIATFAQAFNAVWGFWHFPLDTWAGSSGLHSNFSAGPWWWSAGLTALIATMLVGVYSYVRED